MKKVKDIRSTGRRRARRSLFRSRRDFICEGYEDENDILHSCGKTVKEPPKDAPSFFEDIWPEENRVLSQLQADHMDKDLENNSEQNLAWRCPSCHKLSDQQTAKGESTLKEGDIW